LKETPQIQRFFLKNIDNFFLTLEVESQMLFR